MADYATKANDFMSKANKKLNVRRVSAPNQLSTVHRPSLCAFFRGVPIQKKFVRAPREISWCDRGPLPFTHTCTRAFIVTSLATRPQAETTFRRRPNVHIFYPHTTHKHTKHEKPKTKKQAGMFASMFGNKYEEAVELLAGLHFGHVDHTGCRQLVPATIRPTRGCRHSRVSAWVIWPYRLSIDWWFDCNAWSRRPNVSEECYWRTLVAGEGVQQLQAGEDVERGGGLYTLRSVAHLVTQPNPCT